MRVPPAALHSTDSRPPSPWVVRFAALAPAGEVLDLACGSGRHARLFASLGHQVLAADRDSVALAIVRAATAEAGLPETAIVTQQIDFETTAPITDERADLHQAPLPQSSVNRPINAMNVVSTNVPSSVDCHWPFAAGRFAAIVVTNYLHRPLFPHLVRSLAPGGVLIYETFAAGNAAFGKPSNPDFLLKPAELLHFALGSTPQLRIVAFEDGYVAHPAPAMVQRLCAIRPVDDAGDTLAAARPATQDLRL